MANPDGTLDFQDKLDLAKVIAGLNAEVLELHTQLKKYGGHTAECDSLKIYLATWKGDPPEQQLREPKPKCDCGWDEVKKEEE